MPPSEPLKLRTAKGETFELRLEGVYDNLGIVVLELKAEDGSVRALELNITEFRKSVEVQDGSL